RGGRAGRQDGMDRRAARRRPPARVRGDASPLRDRPAEGRERDRSRHAVTGRDRSPRRGRPAVTLLAVAAACEAATGLALAIAPRLVVTLLLGTEPAGAGLAMSRVAGIALLALGLACWPARGAVAGQAPALRAMSTYNVLATLY